MAKAWLYRSMALAMALVVSPPPAKADAPVKVWIKAGVSYEALLVDQKTCDQQASAAPEAPYVFWKTGGLADTIANSITTSRAHKAFADRCMRRNGYRRIVLSPDEASSYLSAKVPESAKAWFNQFLQQDLSTRLQAAVAAAPTLPEARDEPFTLGGVRFDQKAISVASDNLKIGSTVLSGTVNHRATARLKFDFQAKRYTTTLKAAAGTAFYLQLVDLPDSPSQSIWCGQFQHRAPLASFADVECIWGDEDGYRTSFIGGGQPWLTYGFSGSQALRDLSAPPVLEISDQDLVGPMVFSLVIDRIDAKSVALKAVVTVKGRSSTFWRTDLIFDADRSAFLPFWTHRLILSRSEGGLTASFKADGDGHAPTGNPSSYGS